MLTPLLRKYIIDNKLYKDKKFIASIAVILGVSAAALIFYLTKNELGEIVHTQALFSRNNVDVYSIVYDAKDLSTDFGSVHYYSRPENVGKTFILTNGCNTRMSSDGAGTTYAIARLDTKLFDDAKEIIGDPNPGKYQTMNPPPRELLDDPYQQVKYEGKTYPAGTIFYKARDQPDDGPPNIVHGVYHVKGFNLGLTRYPNNIELALRATVYKYYYNILSDFEERKIKAIHLAPIPGQIFGGTMITENAMSHAIVDFINNRPPDREKIQINIGIPINTVISTAQYIDNLSQADLSTDIKIKHSPATGGDSNYVQSLYFSQCEILIFIIIIILIVILILISGPTPRTKLKT